MLCVPGKDKCAVCHAPCLKSLGSCHETVRNVRGAVRVLAVGDTCSGLWAGAESSALSSVTLARDPGQAAPVCIVHRRNGPPPASRKKDQQQDRSGTTVGQSKRHPAARHRRWSCSPTPPGAEGRKGKAGPSGQGRTGGGWSGETLSSLVEPAWTTQASPGGAAGPPGRAAGCSARPPPRVHITTHEDGAPAAAAPSRSTSWQRNGSVSARRRTRHCTAAPCMLEISIIEMRLT